MMTNAKATIPLHTLDSNKKPCQILMPQIGFGTYKFKKGSGEAEKAVIHALQLGYRAIDTAFIYGGEQTEREVGRAMNHCIHNINIEQTTVKEEEEDGDDARETEKKHEHVSLQRSDIFLTTKQWRAYHGYEPTLQCFSKSLQRLQTDYIDLYLIHWPGPAYNTMNRRKDVMEDSPNGPFVYAKQGHEADQIRYLRSETWRAMEDLLFQGKCRSIGVSNFTIRHLEALKKTARVWPPAVNQIECHPYNPQSELVEYCQKEGIVVVAYASLGGQDTGKKTWNVLGGKLLERAEMKQIGDKYGKTPAQVLLRWATQRNMAVIPKSSNVKHMKLSLEAVDGDWKRLDGGPEGLDAEDMEILNSLDQSIVVTKESNHHQKEKEEQSGKAIRWNEKARLCWVRDPLKMLDFD